jgi:hypothetical protein
VILLTSPWGLQKSWNIYSFSFHAAIQFTVSQNGKNQTEIYTDASKTPLLTSSPLP